MKWIAAEEYDNDALKKLGHVLRQLDFDMSSSWDGIGGSQEITRWELTSKHGVITVESETYIGLSIEGDQNIIQLIKDEFSNWKIR